jgi:hypothetical protein
VTLPLLEGENECTKTRRNMYANMLPKIGKYAVKYAVVFIFELKIFNPFKQRFPQVRKVPNTGSALEA